MAGKLGLDPSGPIYGPIGPWRAMCIVPKLSLRLGGFD